MKDAVVIGETPHTVKSGLTLPIRTMSAARKIGKEQVKAHGGTPYRFEIVACD